MNRTTGYKPDPQGHRRTPFHHYAARALVGAVLAAAVSLSSFAPAVMDQGSEDFATSACTGHAPACGIATSFAAAGKPLPFVPSPDRIYKNGRGIDRDPTIPLDQQPLTDDGAQPNQVFRGVREFGITAMHAPTSDGRYSDCEPATINDEPQLGDLEDEALTLVVDDYGITATGAQRVLEVKQAINGKGGGLEGKAVCAAIAGGSTAFQRYTSGVLSALNAPLDHYVTIIGYRTTATGKTEFQLRNSWGLSWGELGDCWIDEKALDELDDVVVVVAHLKGAA